MLIEFSVKNFCSFRDEVLFSLVKGAGKELENNVLHIQDPPAALNPLLRSGVIYGANAAGKTNLLLALASLRSLITGSRQRGINQLLPVTPYLLSEKTRTQPSVFEIHFIVDKVRYQYGITADKKRIHTEWLYAFPKGKAQRWFQRESGPDTRTSRVRFGNKLKGEKEIWQHITLANGSLLSTAAQLNSKQLTPVYNWFDHTLSVAVRRHAWERTSLAPMDPFSQQQENILRFMQAADFSISGLDLRKTEGDYLDTITHNMPSHSRDLLTSQFAVKNMRILTHHLTEESKYIEMDLREESDGTQKLLCYAGPWITALENGYVMAVDELHDNLHPLLVRYLIEMFHNPELNPHGAQLIFTTHETSILNQTVFRRDQIWFCERAKNLSSTLYPLSDFAVRKGTENIERGYLTGRYGALPIPKQNTDGFKPTHGE